MNFSNIAQSDSAVRVLSNWLMAKRDLVVRQLWDLESSFIPQKDLRGELEQKTAQLFEWYASLYRVCGQSGIDDGWLHDYFDRDIFTIARANGELPDEQFANRILKKKCNPALINELKILLRDALAEQHEVSDCEDSHLYANQTWSIYDETLVSSNRISLYDSCKSDYDNQELLIKGSYA